MKYTALATSISYVRLEIEAESLEEARRIAEQSDGYDWTDEGYGDWEITDVFCSEPSAMSKEKELIAHEMAKLIPQIIPDNNESEEQLYQEALADLEHSDKTINNLNTLYELADEYSESHFEEPIYNLINRITQYMQRR